MCSRVLGGKGEKIRERAGRSGVNGADTGLKRSSVSPLQASSKTR